MKNKVHISRLLMALLYLVFIGMNTYAKNYIVTFTASGDTTTVSTVTVQNLTQSTTVTVPAGNTLELYGATNAVDQVSETVENLRVYPNFTEGTSTISFYTKQPGATQINAFSLDGRKVAGINTLLQTGKNSFKFTLPKGSYVIQVTGTGYTYTAKVINQSTSLSKPEIVYTGTEKTTYSVPQKSKSSDPRTTTMAYTEGDQLIYRGVSGKYASLVPDVPAASKNINFNFVGCTDGDGNNYTTVTIGTQTWMAENLKTTRYKDRTAIPYVSENTAWKNLTTPAYCYFTTNTTFPKNGGLYNWYAVGTGKLAPTRWHVSTDDEWTTLETYLTTNGYALAKSLAAAVTDWTTNTNYGTPFVGAPNNDIKKNNASGFSAIPNGLRLEDGTFGLFYNDAYFWCDVQNNEYEAWERDIYYEDSGVRRAAYMKQGGHSVRCVKNLATIPTLTTTEASSITATSVQIGGNITSDGNDSITVRGLCWNTTGAPTIANSKSTDGISKGIFTRNIVGLTANTTYYVRAYATNTEGTAYGNEQTFKTTTPPVNVNVVDIDGNVYNTIVIGTQTWMVENLKTTKLNDGTPIPLVSDNTWGALNTPAYCWYNNDVTNKTTYGALYNWYTANTGKLAPTGWHVPTDAEWSTLENYLIANGYNYDGTLTGDRTTNNKIAKSLASTTNWTTSTGLGTPGNDLTKNNNSGFSAYPGGWRSWYTNLYTELGTAGYWMTATLSTITPNIIYRSLSYKTNSGVITNYHSKSNGYSVRCIKN